MKKYNIKEEYGVFFDFEGTTIRLPVNPNEFSIKTKSSNKTTELVNLGEINIIKNMPLRDISFKSYLPNSSEYPWVVTKKDFKYPKYYIDKFTGYKKSKKPVRLVVVRNCIDKSLNMKTNMLVTIEDFTVSEIVGSTGEWEYDINLKEYRTYSSQKVTTSNDTKTVEVKDYRSSGKKTNKTYTVKYGDSLWMIAKKELNDGSKYTDIYKLNKTTIDKKNSGTGNSKYTIYQGQVLRIE